MAKHSEIAAGDRHAPVNDSYADRATREADTFLAVDIGKWYTDNDTGQIWELLTVAPSFRRAGVPGLTLDLLVFWESDLVSWENGAVYYDA